MTTLQSVSRQEAVRRLSNVESTDVFYCVNGDVYQNLDQLCAGLERIRDDQFWFHAQWETSDFSRWVRSVVGDEDLAEKLRRCATRMDALEHMRNRINLLRRASTSASPRLPTGKRPIALGPARLQRRSGHAANAA